MVYNKINQANASILNRITVFNLIREHKKIQRDQIKKITGLQKSTLTYILNDLSNVNLIKQTKGKSTGKIGVTPLTITIDCRKHFFLGLHVELDLVRVIIMDFSNSVFYSKDFSFSFTKNTFIEKIENIIEQVKVESGKNFLALGLALPGVMDYNHNSVVVSNLLGLKNIPLGEVLSKKFKIPVFVENNANAAAFGEYSLYYKKTVQNDSPKDLYYVFFHLTKRHKTKNTGIGSGIILNGQIHYGEYNAAGEIGDIIETIVKNNFKNYNIESFQSEFVHILTKAEQRNDKTAVSIVNKFASHLGFYISNIVNIFNTSVVVIGGDYPLSYGNFFKSLKKGIYDNLINFLRDKVQINRSRDERLSAVKGVTVLAQEKILTYEYFKKIFKF